MSDENTTMWRKLGKPTCEQFSHLVRKVMMDIECGYQIAPLICPSSVNFVRPKEPKRKNTSTARGPWCPMPLIGLDALGAGGP